MVYYQRGYHDDEIAGPGKPGYATGIGGLAYYQPSNLDKRYWGSANSASNQYLQAARQIMQGAESADAAMLNAYRDLYRSRLGGAAAGQRQFIDAQSSEAAGQGLSPDVVRRLLASRQAQQSQMLAGAQGELMGQYGMQRAGLIQNTGNSLANLLIDETKFAKNLAAGKNAQRAAMQSAGIGAVAAIGGAALGGGLGAAPALQLANNAYGSYSGNPSLYYG